MRAREAGFKLRVDHTAECPLPFMPADCVHEDSPADEQHLSAKHALVRAAILTYLTTLVCAVVLTCLLVSTSYKRVVGEAYSCNYFAVWCRYRTTSKYTREEGGGVEVGCGARGEGICASSSGQNER
eukprot:127068-Pleurochrysis_carterae.AAC.1